MAVPRVVRSGPFAGSGGRPPPSLPARSVPASGATAGRAPGDAPFRLLATTAGGAVTAGCHDEGMIIEPPTPDRPLAVRSTLLRSVLLVLLDEANGQEIAVAQLCAGMAQRGFTVRGRPSKVVSDALRVEVGKGRAVRLGRGRYALGTLPRTTRWRCHERLREVAQGRVAAIHLARPTRARTDEVLLASARERERRAARRREQLPRRQVRLAWGGVARRRNAGGGEGSATAPRPRTGRAGPPHRAPGCSGGPAP